MNAKAESSKRVEIHVATDGSDKNTGTRQKPFATLERARNEIRRLRKEKALLIGGVRVTVHAGTYYRKKPFVLTRQDSGTARRPIIYCGEGDVRISGGMPVNNFEPVTDRAVLNRLPARARKLVIQADLRDLGVSEFGETVAVGKRLELFFKDKPMTLSRWPVDGFATIADVSEKQRYTVHGVTGSKFPEFKYNGKRPSRWVDEPDVWLKGYWFWDWSDEYQKVKAIDTKPSRIRLCGRHNYGYRSGQRYYALNLLCELDRSGEWYLDRKKGLLYFWPPSRLTRDACVVSIADMLVSMKNVTDVSFRRMTFEASRGTAIVMSGSTRSGIDKCAIRNVGGWATTIKGGCGCGVRGCEIYNPGIGGVDVSGGNRRRLIASVHAVTGNHIHHFSRLARTYSPAVLANGVGIRIANNHIHDAPHTAILIGGNDHVIELNEIDHVCHETGDVGAFYMGRDWTMRGNVVRHNYFHHISGTGMWGAQAVYLDDAASGTNIKGNIFHKTSVGVHIGGGRDNIVDGNVFISCPLAMHMDNRGLNWMKYHVRKGGTLPNRLEEMPYRGELWRKRYPRLVNILREEQGAPKGNIVRGNIVAGSKFIDFPTDDRSLVKADKNLVTGDSVFPGAGKGDFRVNNAVKKLVPGFTLIPFEKIGLNG